MVSFEEVYLTVYRPESAPYRALVFPLLKSKWNVNDLTKLLIMNGFSSAPDDCNAACILQYLVQYVGRQSTPMYVFDASNQIILRAPKAVVSANRFELGYPAETKSIQNTSSESIFKAFTKAWEHNQKKDQQLFQNFPGMEMKHEALEEKERKIIDLEQQVKKLNEELRYSDSGRKKKQYQEANMMIMRAAADVNQMQDELEKEKAKYESLKMELQQTKAKYDLAQSELDKIRNTIGIDWQDHVEQLKQCRQNVERYKTELKKIEDQQQDIDSK